MKTREILERLSTVIESAKKLAVDSLFIQCLDEEVEAYWKNNTKLNEGKVVFSVDSSGDLVYEGIAANCADSTRITVDIERVVEKKKVTEQDILESANELLDLDIKTKKNKLLDRFLQGK